MQHSPQTAVVLAAGRGRRLRPFTDTTPKPLLPVEGRPTLDYIFDALKRGGIKNVTVITHYLAEQIINYVGDGSAWGMQIQCHDQLTMDGTADALAQVSDKICGDTLVLAADYILQPQFITDLVAFHLENKQKLNRPTISISLKSIPAERLSQSSSIRFISRVDQHPSGSPIAEIVEKPAAGTAPSPYASSLIYIVPETITNWLASEKMQRSTRGEFELPSVVNQMIAAGYPAFGLLQSAPPEWQIPNS